MREKLYTIPLNDAINADDECPFCFIEREVEQDLLDFVLGSGSSYMESDIREATDEEGFCRTHFKKMFDYGNTLGNAWILKTHYERSIREMTEQFNNFTPAKSPLMAKFKKNTEQVNPIGGWAKQKEQSCYICSRYADTYDRYLDTFFVMYKSDEAFREKVEHSKGFCLKHFGDLCEAADQKLSEKEKKDFFPKMFRLMIAEMERMSADVAWLVEKFDYRNQNADWGNSRDAIQRGMQKMKGGYPADPIYKAQK
ncbi:MAG: DUF6062 family protein [Lachnospiraceae bacterium]|jgi:hypothetical protein|nr:DUF6062 family protein [Lachnospiraceae bacterium]